MIWIHELDKATQRCEDRFFEAKKNGDLKAMNDAFTDMMDCSHIRIKKTKPASPVSDLRHIGRSTYNGKGELIGFYLEPIYKAR